MRQAGVWRRYGGGVKAGGRTLARQIARAAAACPPSPAFRLSPCRKLELQAQAAAALAAENSWWQDTADSPPNLVTAHTPADYKRLIVEAPPSQLVVVDYLKPSCMGCRRIFPKLKQLAASNPDALFIKVGASARAGSWGPTQLAAAGRGCALRAFPRRSSLLPARPAPPFPPHATPRPPAAGQRGE